MPVISMEYEDLVALIGKEVRLEDLLEIIPMMGAHIERVEGGLIEVEFFPNRPDLYSVEGVARALRGLLEVEVGLREYAVKPSGIELIVDRSVEPVRPYVVGGVVRDVDMNDLLVRSLMDLQEKLHLTVGRRRAKVSVGVHNLDPIVPPFTYKALPPKSLKFVPLGMDEEMDMLEILEKHPKGIDYGHILAGKKEFPIILDAKDQVLSFPPIINGVVTTVTEETKNLFIDVTGTDLKAIQDVLCIVATSLAERGGLIESVEIGYPDQRIVTPDLTPRRKSLSAERVNRLLGLSLSPDEIVEKLEMMRFGVEMEGTSFTVQIPAYRNDVLHPVDLIEDIAIAYGYGKIPPTMPTSMTVGGTLLKEDISECIRDIMIGFGYQEVTTLTLTRVEGDEAVEAARIANPVTEEHTHLRTSLIPSLLEILKSNRHLDLPQRVFEVGDVVKKGVNVRTVAALSIDSKASFTEIKSVVQGFMRDLGKEFQVERLSDQSFIRGRCASIIVDGEKVGRFGELNPELITRFELGYPVAGFEMDLSFLL